MAEVTIDGNKRYIDATESLLYYNVIPTRCINTMGLVVKPKTEEWTFILQRNISYTQKNITVNINPEFAKLDVQVSNSSTGNSAYNYRAKYLGKSENLSKLLKEQENIDTKGDIQVEETSDLSKPFTFSYAFKTKAEKASEKLFIQPFYGLQNTENIFKQTKRALPVDIIYLISNKYSSLINIPEGYEVDFWPERLNYTNELMLINYAISIDDNNVLKIEASYGFNKNIYQPEEYLELKAVYTKMLNKFSEMIVLKKSPNENNIQ